MCSWCSSISSATGAEIDTFDHARRFDFCNLYSALFTTFHFSFMTYYGHLSPDSHGIELPIPRMGITVLLKNATLDAHYGIMHAGQRMLRHIHRRIQIVRLTLYDKILTSDCFLQILKNMVHG
ncbi:hypothetical protein CDAR_219691 [Caerostris darwini]|uniref:Uncharacterized protein n=1 Tax=Caerostris darwini TaxID=1538125 RepID=A0AAV4WZI9_9ARAC|nr:hypothetical protein CDAR_219691 [Caerostris darwini]